MLFQVERPARKCTIMMAQLRGRGNPLQDRSRISENSHTARRVNLLR